MSLDSTPQFGQFGIHRQIQDSSMMLVLNQHWFVYRSGCRSVTSFSHYIRFTVPIYDVMWHAQRFSLIHGGNVRSSLEASLLFIRLLRFWISPYSNGIMVAISGSHNIIHSFKISFTFRLRLLYFPFLNQGFRGYWHQDIGEKFSLLFFHYDLHE